MQVPFLDLKVQYRSIKEEVNSAIQNVLDNTAYVLGKAVTDFENDFAKAHNAKYCIATGSGTDANHIALWALGIKAGDEVIVPANTFIATAWGATLCGATPVFVDCEPESYNIDPNKIEAAITPKTKAIILVHLYGQAADLDPILEIAKKHNLFVIEDTAQAFGTNYKNKKVGAIGNIGTTSFFPSKNLGAYGDGGMMFTNDEELAKKLKMIANHGSKERYVHEVLGLNSRLDTIQAAILNVKLKYIDKWNGARSQNAELYKEFLKDADVILPYCAEFSTHIYHQFSIRVKDRKGLQEHLNSKGIPTAVHYPIPLNQQPAFKNISPKSNVPVAEKVAQEIISLPMFPELTKEEIKYISESITEFTGKK